MKANKRQNKAKNTASQKVDPEATLLKGKFQCECHGMLHKLVNNCINCGRIVCEQEGEGDCQTCGSKIVARAIGKGIQQIKSNQLNSEFPEFDPNMDLDKQKAIQLKNTLIKRDKSDFIKNNVYDEQVDWYQIQDNVWQSKETREKAIEKLIERNNKIEELTNANDVYFDPHTQQWIKKEQHFDEKGFLDEARQYSQNTTNKNGDVSLEAGNMSKQEKQIYESVRTELQNKNQGSSNNNENQNKNNSKNNKNSSKQQQQVKQQQQKGKENQSKKAKTIVQNDDDQFQSQLI